MPRRPSHTSTTRPAIAATAPLSAAAKARSKSRSTRGAAAPGIKRRRPSSAEVAAAWAQLGGKQAATPRKAKPRTTSRQGAPKRQLRANFIEPSAMSTPAINSPVLAQPVTIIETHSDESGGMAFAMATMQGWRETQEDAFILEEMLFIRSGWGFFSVLDGHGGKTIADEAAKLLLPQIILQVEPVCHSVQESLAGLRQAFLDVDFVMRKSMKTINSGAGSTCTSVLVTPTHALLANLGDSRAMFVRNGELVFATTDHKPSDETERNRIRAAGHSVDFVGGAYRVSNTLAVSRAFGDFYLKDKPVPAPAQAVSPEPDTHAVQRQPGTVEFLILACDGVWDVLSNAEAIAIVIGSLSTHGLTAAGAQAASEALVQQSLARGSRDNISAIVVTLDPIRVAT